MSSLCFTLALGPSPRRPRPPFLLLLAPPIVESIGRRCLLLEELKVQACPVEEKELQAAPVSFLQQQQSAPVRFLQQQQQHRGMTWSMQRLVACDAR